MRSFLDRYLGGEYCEVWSELQELGEAVREEPLFSDARDVALATMRRARWNIEELIPRLETVGYRFGFWEPTFKEWPVAWYERPYIPPFPDTSDALRTLEATVGTFPLSLSAWWEVVGHVDFCGFHPDWNNYDADPLQVHSLLYTMQQGDAGWYVLGYEEAQKSRKIRIENGWLDPEAPNNFDIDITLDVIMKAGYSGGGPRSTIVPNASADGLLVGSYESDILGGMPFVSYLRACFEAGGFFGYHEMAMEKNKQNFNLKKKRKKPEIQLSLPSEHRAFLTEGLLPI